MQSKEYIGVQQLSFEALRPLQLAEDLQTKVNLEEDFAVIEENLPGMWFVFDSENNHVLSFNILENRNVKEREGNNAPKHGSWRPLQKDSAEIVVSTKRYVLDLWSDLRTCTYKIEGKTFTGRRMMDPMQFLGEWSWCHDGTNRECELILNG